MLSDFNEKKDKSKKGINNQEEQFVVFLVGEEEFGVNIKQTREIISAAELTYIPDAPDFVEGVIDLRGEIVPVINLSKRLSLESKENNNEQKIIIVEIDENLVGVMVKNVEEIIRIPVNNIGEPPKITKKINKNYVSGVGKLENRLLILLNMNRILTTQEMEEIEDIKV